jgi:nitrogen fixation NifU-like protein
MEQLYQQVILDHSKERHGDTLIDPFDGESFQVNPTCGDQVTMRVKLGESDSGPVVDGIGWDGHGCSISQASISVLNDLVLGKDMGTVDRLHETVRDLMGNRGNELEPERMDELGDATAFVGVAKFHARIKCALLGWMALRDALAHALTQEES